MQASGSHSKATSRQSAFLSSLPGICAEEQALWNARSGTRGDTSLSTYFLVCIDFATHAVSPPLPDSHWGWGQVLHTWSHSSVEMWALGAAGRCWWVDPPTPPHLLPHPPPPPTSPEKAALEVFAMLFLDAWQPLGCIFCWISSSSLMVLLLLPIQWYLSNWLEL